MTSNNPAIEGRHQPLVVPLNLWLQWDGDGVCEDGEVSEGDVTWCRDKIFDGDIEYVHAGEIRRALMGHQCSELWGDTGLIAATMRCVDAIGRIEDLVTTDHETKEAFIQRVRGILGHNASGVQQESDNYWVARVQGSAPKCYAGQTRKESIRMALKGTSIPPNV